MKLLSTTFAILMFVACGQPSQDSGEPTNSNTEQSYQLSSSNSDSVAKICYQSMSECELKKEKKSVSSKLSCVEEKTVKNQSHPFCLVEL